MPLKGLNYWDYGMRWGRMHRADIAVLGGHDVIRAPLAGKVTHVGWLNNFSGYGFVVKFADYGLVDVHAPRQLFGSPR